MSVFSYIRELHTYIQETAMSALGYTTPSLTPSCTTAQDKTALNIGTAPRGPVPPAATDRPTLLVGQLSLSHALCSLQLLAPCCSSAAASLTSSASPLHPRQCTLGQHPTHHRRAPGSPLKTPHPATISYPQPTARSTPPSYTNQPSSRLPRPHPLEPLLLPTHHHSLLRHP